MTTEELRVELEAYQARVETLERAQELLGGVCLIGTGEIVPLRPVLDATGLTWRCQHEVEHSSVTVARLKK